MQEAVSGMTGWAGRRGPVANGVSGAGRKRKLLGFLQTPDAQSSNSSGIDWSKLYSGPDWSNANSGSGSVRSKVGD